jgi:VCBS repeat-containing protein
MLKVSLTVAVLVVLATAWAASTASASKPFRATPVAPSDSASRSTSAAADREWPAVHIGPGSMAGYIPLDAFGFTPTPIADEEVINFPVPSFVFNDATHDRVGVSANGYLVVGGGDMNDNNCCNPAIGSTNRPNGVLAPFWTDLDGTDAPGIYAAILTDGVGNWLVVEWRVKVFSTNSERHFQVWIGLNGTEDITYAYDLEALPADPFGYPLVIGAENMDGTSGATIHGLPTEDLRVTSDPVPPNTAPAAGDDAYSTEEDRALTVAAPGVLDDDTDADGDALSAVVVDEPAHGELTLNEDGSFSYTPAADFNGSDSFTYKASDGRLDSNAATVTIAVDPVNDSPKVTVAAGGACGGNDRSSTIMLRVTDADDPASSLKLSGASANQALVPNAKLRFGGAGADRSLTATAERERTGSAVLLVSVSDGSTMGAVAVTLWTNGNRSGTVTGTGGPDVLLGQDGADTIVGLGGDDLLCGGRGNDTLTGGAGADRLSGGRDTDTVTDLNPAEGDSQDGTIP